MRFLFDIQHPAFLHFFRPVMERMIADDHSVLIATREKDITNDLVAELGWPYESISRAGRGRLGLAKELVVRTGKMLRLCRKFRPQAILAVSCPSAGLAGTCLRIPTIMLDEAEHANLQRRLSLPFASEVFTGSGYQKTVRRQSKFKGVWVQSYVGPRHFSPDPNVLRPYGVDPTKPYFVIRTVAWGAAHDFGHQGVRVEALAKAIQDLKPFGDVYLSTEGELPEELMDYQCNVPSALIHHLLAFATLFVGESTTMASEAAILGTPAIYFGPLRWGYMQHLTESDMLQVKDTADEAFSVAREWLQDPQSKAAQSQRADEFNKASDDIVELVYASAIKHASQR